MRIDGRWLLCDDGILRPVILAEALDANGAWKKLRMLVDTGADCTVFSADIFRELGFQPASAKQDIEGVGGRVESMAVTTKIRVARETGVAVSFEGPFAAVSDPKALDMSVLGRDLTNLFAVIVDRPKDVVCLLGQRHRYVIVEG